MPGACSVAFSVRELIRQAYLLAARILLRPLIERVSTFTYLIDHDEAITSWQSGWPHSSRPSLQTRLRTIGGRDNVPPAIVTAGLKDLLDDFNSVVHGDRRSAHNSAVLLPDGAPGYTVSKDTASPARADEICSCASAFAMVLTVRCGDVFPHRG